MFLTKQFPFFKPLWLNLMFFPYSCYDWRYGLGSYPNSSKSYLYILYNTWIYFLGIFLKASIVLKWQNQMKPKVILCFLYLSKEVSPSWPPLSTNPTSMSSPSFCFKYKESRLRVSIFTIIEYLGNIIDRKIHNTLKAANYKEC